MCNDIYIFNNYRDESGNIEPGCENRVCQNIVLNVKAGVSRTVIGVALCIAIILSYALMLVPAREHIESTIMK